MIIFSVYGFLHKYFSFLKYFTQGVSKYSAWTLQLLWGIHWLSTDDSLTPQTRNDNTFTPQTRSDDTLTTLTWHLSLTPRLTRAWNICHPIFMIIVFREFFLLLILYDSILFLACERWLLVLVFLLAFAFCLDLRATHAGPRGHSSLPRGHSCWAVSEMSSPQTSARMFAAVFFVPTFIDECPAKTVFFILYSHFHWWLSCNKIFCSFEIEDFH